MKVFIDTSAFIALFVTSEEHHQSVVNKYNGYVEINTFFFTNNFVLAETYTRLLYHVNKGSCKNVIDHINRLEEEGKIQIFEVDKVLFKKSEKFFLKFADHGLSFTDAAIYTCIKEFKLDEVFTLDKDFKKVGLLTSF